MLPPQRHAASAGLRLACSGAVNLSHRVRVRKYRLCLCLPSPSCMHHSLPRLLQRARLCRQPPLLPLPVSPSIVHSTIIPLPASPTTLRAHSHRSSLSLPRTSCNPRHHSIAQSSRTFASMAEPLSHSRSAGVERLADSIDKPLLDNRSYRVVKLPNQLEALLIHDADTDKASAAMDVNVGSFSDVKELPGIAHAVEHLLFMGTEKVRHVIALYNRISLIIVAYSTPARTSTTPT